METSIFIPNGVRWGLARQIVMAWALTIPACAVTAGVCYALFSLVF